MRKRLGKVLSLVLATMLLVGSFGSSIFADYDPGTGRSSETITWSSVSGVDYYVISRDGSPAFSSVTLPSSATSYTFTGLTPGQSYNWQVEAWQNGDTWTKNIDYYYYTSDWSYHNGWTHYYLLDIHDYGYGYSATVTRSWLVDNGFTNQGLGHWDKDISGGSPASIISAQSGSFTATSVPIATVVVNAGTGAATVGGAGSYGPGDSVSLTATPALGYDPSTLSWSGDFTGSFTVPNDLAADTTYTVTASYTAYPAQTPTLSVTGGSGTITPSGALAVGSSVTFTATADITHDPSTLVWSSNVTDNGDGTATGVVGVSGLNVTATFTAYPQQEATLSVTGGTGTGAGYYTIGDIVTFTASPATGYNPATLSWTGATPGSGNTATASMVLGGISASATFDKYVYAVTANAQGFGSVTESPSVSVEHGDTTILHAVDGTHGTFSHWLKDGVNIGGSSTLTTDAITSNVTYTAVFESNTYDIYAYPSPEAGGTASVAADETHTPTETQPLAVILTATANPGYEFSHWAQEAADGTDLGSGNPMTVYPQDHTDYYAVFELKPTHAVSAVPNVGAVAGNITEVTLVAATGVEPSPGVFTEGSEVMLSATPGPEYRFVRWEKEGVVVSTLPVIVGEADAEYTGIFEYVYYTVTASVNVAGRGSVVVNASPVIQSHSVDITASPESGFYFSSFVDGDTGDFLGATLTLTFVPVEDRNIVAVFEAIGEGQPEDELEEPIPEDIPDEEPIPEDVPEEEDNEPEEVANDEGDEEILDEDIPEDTPEMPQTAGLPAGLLFLAGSSLAGLGIKLKKKNK